jgi:UDP-glucose 4-epimerase
MMRLKLVVRGTFSLVLADAFEFSRRPRPGRTAGKPGTYWGVISKRDVRDKKLLWADRAMAVLITGGAGYIGSHMVLGLLDNGEDVLVIDDLSMGLRWAVPVEARFVEGSVGDYELVRGLMRDNRIDAVIHFAGSVVVPESVKEPLHYYLNNTCNSRSLIACAVEAGAHFIFSSTAAVYGMSKSPVGEDDETRPVSPYGSSKLMTETILRDAATAHGLSYVVLRYFNVAGADPAGRTGQSTANATHLIKVAVQAALGERSYVEVYGSNYPTRDGTCLRDYIHVADLVSAHVAALEFLRSGGQGQVLNCGYGRGSSVLEVIAAVERAAAKHIPIRMGERRPGDMAVLVAKADRIKQVLGWRPQYDDLETIVQHALAWERKLAARDLAA